MEGVLAAFAQFDNDVRSDRRRAGMKAALELGRWVFLAPIGYINAPRALGKSLMPDPERAPLVRRAFEEYATGRFTKQQLLQQVTARGLRNRRGQPLSSQASGMLLRNQLYAGIVDVAEYEVRGGEGLRAACQRGHRLPGSGRLSGRIIQPLRLRPVSSGLSRSMRRKPGSRPCSGWSWLGLAGHREVTLREGTARAGLQVALEAKGGGLVGELDGDVQLPWAVLERVNAAARVVVSEAERHIVGHPNVERLRLGRCRDDVDEALGSGHGAVARKADAERRNQAIVESHTRGVQLLPAQAAAEAAILETPRPSSAPAEFRRHPSRDELARTSNVREEFRLGRGLAEP